MNNGTLRRHAGRGERPHSHFFPFTHTKSRENEVAHDMTRSEIKRNGKRGRKLFFGLAFFARQVGNKSTILGKKGKADANLVLCRNNYQLKGFLQGIQRMWGL